MNWGEQIFTKKQKEHRKDIERCFGVLQAWIQILRRQSMRCDKNEIFGISETCVIIHNLLIQMCPLGAFDEEVRAGEDASRIIEELCTSNGVFDEQGAAEQEGNWNGLDGEILSVASAEAEKIFILDSLMTNELLHNSWTTDLFNHAMQGSGEAGSDGQTIAK